MKAAIIAGGCVVAAGAVVAAVLLLRHPDDKPGKDTNTPPGDAIASTTGAAGEQGSGTPTDAESMPTSMIPLDQVVFGTTGVDGNDTASSAPQDGTTATQHDGMAIGRPELDTGDPILDDGELRVKSVVGYYGSFLEDGSNEVLSDVTAILVTNLTDRMVQVAQITFQVNATEQARFQLSNLPAGESVLVLEQNRRPFSAADSYQNGHIAKGFGNPPSLLPEKFALDTTTAGKLTLKNLTGESYGKVYVYYKYYQSGMYMGGITYRVPFENISAYATLENVAGHFDPEASRVMSVEIVPENVG